MNQSKWNKVGSQPAPPDHIEVLVIVEDEDGNRGMEKAAFIPELKQWYPTTSCARDCYIPGKVTDWQPLPELPTEEVSCDKDQTILQQQMLIKQLHKLLMHPHVIVALSLLRDKSLVQHISDLQRATYQAING